MDFYQHGPVALHDYGQDVAAVRALVDKEARRRPACLVLPMLYEEMTRPAIRSIRDGLRQLDYLHEVIVPLTAESEEQVEEVVRFFSELPMPVRVLWCEGPQVREILDQLADRGLDLTGFRGKGLAVWLGFGAASDENLALALHDADIENYDPRIVDRLLLPVLAENLDFFFAKGYYARLTGDRLYGRVVRLFVWPFLDALQASLDEPSPFIQYLRGFRYPLSGEMALTTDFARNLRMPTDWGLEVGLLGEVYRNATPKRICQVDLGIYSHKHKQVGTGSREGLQRMVTEIGATTFRLLAGMEGAKIGEDMLTTLRITYRREAQEAIRRYHADAVVNLLSYDRHDEEIVADRFERLVPEAGQAFRHAPLADQISEWVRAISAFPESPHKLHKAGVTQAELARLRQAASGETR